MLYITTGDGTSDSDGWNSGQSLDDLLGSVLRIDVHRPDGDKPYSIPADNPFLETKGALPEIWAYGLRNPWRMSIDPKQGHVWVGNNGQDLWETAHLVKRGDNLGWSVYEGSHPFYAERQRGPTPIVPPTIEHSHAEFRSLTGGVVYYGDVLPDLAGVYIYGDYSSGRIWGMKHDGERAIWHRELADTSLMIAGFAVDQRGELLVVDHAGGIYRLVPAKIEANRPPFPTRLSETGLFANTAQHEVAAGVIPYTVKVPGWHDGATGQRFMAIPGEEKVTYHAGRSWEFPDGTALVQTLTLDSKPHRNPRALATARRMGRLQLPLARRPAGRRTVSRAQRRRSQLCESSAKATCRASSIGDSPAVPNASPATVGPRISCWESRAVQLDRPNEAGVNQLKSLTDLGLFTAELPSRRESETGRLRTILPPISRPAPAATCTSTARPATSRPAAATPAWSSASPPRAKKWNSSKPGRSTTPLGSRTRCWSRRVNLTARCSSSGSHGVGMVRCRHWYCTRRTSRRLR